jgi:hypothetical protein
MSLEMGQDVSLLSFINNEKRILRGKLENKNLNKEKIQAGIEILNNIIEEIKSSGEQEVLRKHGV